MTGADLRAFRYRVGLTQTVMAEHLHLNLRRYQDIEAGKANLKPEHIALVELASLKLALQTKNIDLALPGIRRDALDFAALIRGD